MKKCQGKREWNITPEKKANKRNERGNKYKEEKDKVDTNSPCWSVTAQDRLSRGGCFCL